MLTQEEALVRGVDHQRVVGQPLGIQIVQQAANTLIDRGDGAQISLHVALKLEMVVLGLRREGKDFSRVFVNQPDRADIVRRGQLTVRHAGYQQITNFLPAIGLYQTEVPVGHIVGNPHLCLGRCLRAVFVVIAKGIRQGNVCRVVIFVLGMIFPGAVWRFVMAHQHEGLGGVARFEPVQRFVGDDVCHIARVAGSACRLMEHRVVVVALAGHHRPVVKACGLVRRAFAQMPLAKDRSLVAAAAQVLGHIGQAIIDSVSQCHDAVHMVVGAGQDCCSTGRADGVADVAVVHPHAFIGQAVDVGGVVNAVSVAADGLGCMVVGHDEENVGSRHVVLVSDKKIRLLHGRSSRRRSVGSKQVWLRRIRAPKVRHARRATSCTADRLARQ